MVILQPESSTPFTGLGTFSITVPVAGDYTLECKATLLPPSGLQIVLSQTGSVSDSVTIGGTATNPSASQQSLGTSTQFECAAGDVLSVALTSSAAADQLANSVKGIINVFRQGA